MKEFYEKYFEFENNYKESINSKVNIPIAILSLILSAFVYFINSYDFKETDNLSILFYSLCIISLLFVLLVFLNLCKSYFNYTYAYLPKTNEIDTDFKKIEEYYENEFFKNIPQIEKNELIKIKKEIFIENYYKKCIDVNKKNNHKRAKHIHLCNRYLILSIVFLFISSIVFFIKTISTHENTKEKTNKEINLLKIEVKK